MNQLTETVLTKNLQAQFNQVDVLPLCLSGPRGIGKTSSIKQITEELGAKLLSVSIPSKTLEFFSGIPSFSQSTHFLQYSDSASAEPQLTTWSVPELIVQANTLAEQHGKCVILLDDFHKLNHTTSAVMYDFLLERRLSGYKLHPMVAIVTAMNRSEESGGGTMEEPIKDRLSIIDIQFDFNHWFNNFGKFLHHYISSFLKTNSTFVLEDETIDLRQSGSPRSWSQLSTDFDLYDNEFIVNNISFLAEQKISKNASTELTKHIHYINSIDFSSVVKQQQMKSISELTAQDQILWSYIINYVDTIKDAVYIIKLINHNISERTFIGYLVAEIFYKYQANQSGKPITIGQRALIAKILGNFNPADFNTTANSAIATTNFDDISQIQSVSAEYIL